MGSEGGVRSHSGAGKCPKPYRNTEHVLGGAGFPAENLEFASKLGGIMAWSAIIISCLWLPNMAGIG